jgi:hypothetical protein
VGGGGGPEGFVRDNFGRPDLVMIPGFWHAASCPEELATAAAAHTRRQLIFPNSFHRTLY